MRPKHARPLTWPTLKAGQTSLAAHGSTFAAAELDAALARLTFTSRQALLDAALTLDAEQVRALADALDDAMLVCQIHALADRFAFDTLIALLQKQQAASAVSIASCSTASDS